MSAYYILVREGSALERLVDGKDFSEAAHAMAELLERLISERREPRTAEERGIAVLEAEREVYVEAGDPARYSIVEQDGITVREVSEDEVLQLARDQYPAGLVPVGVDDGDEDEPAPNQEAEEEDLSHLA